MRGKGILPKIIANPVVATERMSICRKCPHFQPKVTRCDQCGCIMKMKVRLKHAQCPLEKW